MFAHKTLAAGTTILALALSPALADPKHKGHRGKEHHRGHNAAVHYGSCPPGLAKKSPACIPPGQAKKIPAYRRGDILRIGDFVVIRDPRRYDLERRDSWDYYRDDGYIYRIDRDTRKVLAVIELINVLAN